MDYGHEQTDKMLTQLERRLKAEYSKAARGISRSMREYLKDFEREDSEMVKLLNENKITEKKYLAWRNTQMATGTRWEQMKATIAEDLQNVSNIAADMIRDHSYDAYALNHNYGTFEIEKGVNADTSYTLYDRATVERLVAQNPKLLHAPGKRTQKLIEEGKAKLWNNRQVQSVMTQAVLQGMPVPKIANYLAKTVGERNLHVATRSARTLITGAENAGRVDSYDRARGMGINVKARWMATLDSRTRHSHRQLDGEVADDDGLFSNGLRFPGDPDGPFSEICNCRCTLVGWIKGINDDLFDPSNRITGKGFTDYEDWKQAHEKGLHPNGMVDGKDLSATWERRKGKYDFEIEDVINAQGFDGKPRVVDADEFDRLVSESNFIAQRTYSAPTQEILDDYRDQLYNGKWYVDCSTGGAQYGQGMYCAADYTGKLTNGIRNEMKHYQMLNASKLGEISQEDLARIAQAQKSKADEILRKYKAGEISKERGLALYREINAMEASEYLATYGKSLGVNGARAYTETFTLDKSAKIINYDELIDMQRHEGLEGAFYAKRINSLNLSEDEEAIAVNYFGRYLYQDSDGLYSASRLEELERRYSKFDNMNSDEYDKMEKVFWEKWKSRGNANKELAEYRKRSETLKKLDAGSYATLKGYDAINAGGHGESGSYTVILNRTKVIFKKG